MQPRPRRPPVQPTAKTVHLPAPVGGLNSIDGASVMAPTDGVLIYNMVAGQNGLRVRPGYSSFFTGLGGAGRSIFPFTGSNASASTDRLFAAYPGGIKDIGGGGVAAVVYGTTTGNAGWGTCVTFNTSADRYLVVCDEVNGLYIYKESTATWAQVTMGGGAGQISGVDPANFVHVTVFKNRLWFTQKSTTLAWYMGTNALFGAATSFDFGPRMKAGGDLRGLFNWSYDGGSGIDTLLVGISGGGDVVIYQGTDPSTAASFSLKGTWSVSGVPTGRRLATEYGGDLLILSTIGVLPLSRLVVGNSDLDRSQYSTSKITNAFATAMAQFAAFNGWALQVNPNDSSLLVNVPKGDGTTTAFQFVMSLATKAWSQYGNNSDTACTGYPMLGCGVWQNRFYFGDLTGKVYRLTTQTDTSQPDLTTTAIEYEVITSFQDLGTTLIKQIQEIRPRFLTYMNQTTANFTGMFGAAARYDYDATELTANSSSAVPAATTAPTVYKPIFGATGMGNAAAVGVRGKATCQTTLIGIDVVYTEGGFQ